jgi:hypothetical protein
VKAKRSKPARVYPAESDPRQWTSKQRAESARERFYRAIDYDDTESLATEFGPWMRGADGRWQRDRRKRR